LVNAAILAGVRANHDAQAQIGTLLCPVNQALSDICVTSQPAQRVLSWIHFK
jgi:hypothetical protein